MILQLAIRADRTPSVASLFHLTCLVGLLLSSRSMAEESEPLISALEFSVIDVDTAEQPLRSFRYSVDIYSSDLTEPHSQSDVPYRCADGILRIPKPYPPQGRVRIWIDADDETVGYRTGYASFPYRIDEDKATEPVEIPLELRIVLSGKVFDKKTDQPIAGAEVAPMVWGHHGTWADWDQAVRTDKDGRFRIATTSASDIAARHPDYREVQPHFQLLPTKDFRPGHNFRGVKKEPYSLQLRMEPLITLRGRAVDSQGRPVSCSVGTMTFHTRTNNESDEDGRFLVKVTQSDLEAPEKIDIDIYAENYPYIKFPLAKFSLDRETTIMLKDLPVLSGRILDSDGVPVEKYKLALASHREKEWNDTPQDIPTGENGRFETSIDLFYNYFTLWVSIDGAIRTVKTFSKEEISKRPTIIRLPSTHRLTGKLLTNIPLTKSNIPHVILYGEEDWEGWRATVDAGGRFVFPAIADGKYSLEIRPPMYNTPTRGEPFNGGVFGYSVGGWDSPNKPFRIPVEIDGADIAVEPIDLHKGKLLPGRIKGVVFKPDAPTEPLACAFGYICRGEDDFDSIGGSYHLMQFMTDADGRFEIDHFPPEKYTLRFTDRAHSYGHNDPPTWIHVESEKTLNLRLFAPESNRRLAIDFRFGNGMFSDVHAGAGLDAHVLEKYYDWEKDELPWIEDDELRFRATPAEIFYKIEPLDESIGCRPVCEEHFVLSPQNLLEEDAANFVISNMSPGRWRLTLTTHSGSVYTSSETFLVREFEFTEEMKKLEIAMPPAALAGRFDYPNQGGWARTTVEVIPQGKTTAIRTCEAESSYRFIGLKSGKYSLRFRNRDHVLKQINDITVKDGETKWMEPVILKAAAKHGDNDP